MPHHDGALSAAQIEQFTRDGFVRIDEAFSRELADACRRVLWLATGCAEDAPATWTRPVVRIGEIAALLGRHVLQPVAADDVLHVVLRQDAVDELQMAVRVDRHDEARRVVEHGFEKLAAQRASYVMRRSTASRNVRRSKGLPIRVFATRSKNARLSSVKLPPETKMTRSARSGNRRASSS